uniref:Uncharacterized protein n=1 Tax=Mus musculus TaxID=10090 RepID=Q3V0R0_MOUSE|nr:unnamed protein product [Mus musculus]
MLQQAHLNAAASSINTLTQCSTGPKKASLLNCNSRWTDIVWASNPWSLRQSSIRSFYRRFFTAARPLAFIYSWPSSSCYIGNPFFFDFGNLVPARVLPLPQDC